MIESDNLESPDYIHTQQNVKEKSSPEDLREDFYWLFLLDYLFWMLFVLLPESRESSSECNEFIKWSRFYDLSIIKKIDHIKHRKKM